MMIPYEVMDAQVEETKARLAAKDARIAELEKAFAAALRWLPRDIAGDVQAKELPKGDYNGEYMNDLADMRAARSL